MILCDRCNEPWHLECQAKLPGSKLHDGPWFCVHCRAHIATHGAADVTEDFALMDYLFAGVTPGDVDEKIRVLVTAKLYRRKGNEVQACASTPTREEVWVNVPPVPSRR